MNKAAVLPIFTYFGIQNIRIPEFIWSDCDYTRKGFHSHGMRRNDSLVFHKGEFPLVFMADYWI